MKSLPNLLFGVLCLPGDQSHPVCATVNKPSCVLHLLDWLIGSRDFSSLEWRPEFWVLHQHLLDHQEREFQKNIYFCFIDWTKSFDYVDHNKFGKSLKRCEYQTTWPASWEISIQVKKQQLEQDMEKQTLSRLGKEYIKALYCYPVYLTYMQNTLCEMLGWMMHKMESR